MIGRIGRVAARFALLVALALVASQIPVPVLAEGDITWRAYDVTVEVRPDGTLHVVEDVEIAFDGSFSQGHRAIPLDRIEEIRGVTVSVGDADGTVSPARYVEAARYTGEPGTFTTSIEGGELRVNYGFLPTGTATAATDLRSVVIEYDALGAIHVHDEVVEPYQEIRWTAISPDISEVGRVAHASATILFPRALAAGDTRFDPEPDEVRPDAVTWKRAGLSGGDALVVLAAFPPITSATEPTWQPEAVALDRRAEREDQALGLSLIVGPAMAVGFGLLILLMRRGSRRNARAGLVADVLPAPPDDLPAGLVGALIDRSFDANDAVAMLVDLDRRGVIELRERPIEGEGEDDPARFQIVLHRPLADVAAWERPMLEGLFGNVAAPGKEVTFAALRTLRANHQSRVSGALEQELFARGYYEEHPSDTRKRWILRSLGMGAAFAIPVGAMALWTRSFAPAVIVLGLLLGALLITAIVVGAISSVKSVAGEEETAKWKAFGRYLKHMEREMPVAERLVLIERYLPWAVALGFDRSWQAWMPAPERQRSSDDVARADWTPAAAPSRSGGGFSAGDFQRASDRGLASLQAGSGSVFVMLNAAVSSFGAGSGSTSGASGSGGSASVGSSGGGSHSFS